MEEMFKERSRTPPSRRGGRADLTNGTLPQVIGAAGEVSPLFRQLSDLPSCALSEVALHFVYRAQRPLLRGGVSRTFFNMNPIHSHLLTPEATIVASLRDCFRKNALNAPLPAVDP